MLKPVMFISGTLAAGFNRTDVTLVLDEQTRARLQQVLQPGDRTYAILESPTARESIRIIANNGMFDTVRGLDNTEPANFPRGSCIKFEVTPSLIIDMICNYECCEGDIHAG